MNRGLVYYWAPDAVHPLGGRAIRTVRPLPRLEQAFDQPIGLSGRFVVVRNATELVDPEADGPPGSAREQSIGDAEADEFGDFLFEPCRGGGGMGKAGLADAESRRRHIEASRFGEVNAYYHVDRLAAYLANLLDSLGARPLPRVVVVVNADQAAPRRGRDGLRRPFQGGRYLRTSRRGDTAPDDPNGIEPEGEIRLGPGRGLTKWGALAEAVGGRYRLNASHNAGIIYHVYGHHLTRHTADFRGDAPRGPGRQDVKKIAMDEGTCDYFAAVMLGSPHVWAWHRRHDEGVVHERSLWSRKTMRDFDHDPRVDAHSNGTIWGAALWDLRADLAARDGLQGAIRADRLVVEALLTLGRSTRPGIERTAKSPHRAREPFGVGLAALLDADWRLSSGADRASILAAFEPRGVHPALETWLEDSQVSLQG